MILSPEQNLQDRSLEQCLWHVTRAALAAHSSSLLFFFFFFFFFFLLLFLHSFFHLYSVLVVVVLYSFAIPKPRSEVVAARDKSSTRRGVGDTTNVSVVT